MCSYNGNKFQRCTTEVVNRLVTKDEEENDEENSRDCERERFPRQRQGGPRPPVRSRTVGAQRLHGLSSWYFSRWFALGGARRRQRQEDRSLKLPGAPQKETGDDGINNQTINILICNLWQCINFISSRGNVRQRELCGSGCFGHLPSKLIVGVEDKLKGFNQM